MEKDKSFVEFSVQGSHFVLKKSFILSYDWILTNVLTGSILWETFSDSNVYYLDCDATSFRYILNVLKHPDDVRSINDLGSMDFTLLQRTKDYLMINDPGLNSEIEKYVRKEKEKDKLLKEKDKILIDLLKDMKRKRDNHVVELEEKSARYDDLLRTILQHFLGEYGE